MKKLSLSILAFLTFAGINLYAQSNGAKDLVSDEKLCDFIEYAVSEAVFNFKLSKGDKTESAVTRYKYLQCLEGAKECYLSEGFKDHPEGGKKLKLVVLAAEYEGSSGRAAEAEYEALKRALLRCDFFGFQLYEESEGPGLGVAKRQRFDIRGGLGATNDVEVMVQLWAPIKSVIMDMETTTYKIELVVTP